MKVFRWGVCAVAALLMAAGSSFANNSEIDAMKSAMDNMKQEMDAMRATMSAEREAMRESAGGTPEALRTKGGNATVRIGGSIVVRYYANFDSNDNDQGSIAPSGGEYADKIGWTMDTASINFDVKISEDLSAYIDVRASKFDKAYFQWNNIGGSSLGVQVGFIGIPCGMYDASWSPINNVFINNSFTKSYQGDASTSWGVSPQDDLTRMGAKFSYTIADQLKLTASIYNDTATEGGAIDSNVINANGEVRNGGINHSLMLEYSPAFMEGLHFSATYTGQVDTAQVGTDTAAVEINERGTSYVPQFDLGVAYIADKFAVWATGDFTVNPGFYSNTYALAFSTGANYNITEKFAVALGGDFAYGGSGNEAFIDGLSGLSQSRYSKYSEVYAVRAKVGAKYTFCNGVWVRGEYGHTWYGVNTVDRDQVRGADSFVFETGVSF